MRFPRELAGVALVFVTGLVFLLLQHGLGASSTPQALPFTQSWTDANLIIVNDNWSGVPGIVGYRGDDLTTATGTDPQTILADGTTTPINVFANQTSGTFGSGGVAEFDGMTNPTIAIQGSGTADAPFVLLSLDTAGLTSVNVAYNLRDLDPSSDNAVQQVALQYRVGSTGDFTNVPAAYVPDATDPGTATRLTPISVTLPASVDDQPLVQLRIITTNAVGNDEWVGIDDISVTGVPSGPTDPSATGSASPALVQRGASTVLTVTVTPGMNPTSAALTVTADLSAIDGAPATTFFDDGVFPDAVAADNIFSYSARVPTAVAAGVKSIAVTIRDAQSRTASTIMTLEVLDPTPPPFVSIELVPFSQDWSNTSLITADDDWSAVPGIGGYLGELGPGAPTGLDPQTITDDLPSLSVDAIANQTDPNVVTAGGVAEFELPNPTIALQGSGTADAPTIVLNVNTSGQSAIRVSYNLRDIDGSADDAIQPVALQYRVGSIGPFVNVPAGFVADATTGPNLADLVTPVSAMLPADADNRVLVQIRIITANAEGPDEWVGIDDITVAPANSSPSGAGSADPFGVLAGGTTLLSVFVTPGANPPSTGITVVADLMQIGGSAAQAFFDDGTHGDIVPGDRVFSYQITVAAGAPVGPIALPAAITDAELRSGNTTISLEVTSPPTPPSAIGAAAPSSVAKTNSTLLTVAVTPGANPTSTAMGVAANLSAVAGSASQTLFDDGTNGDLAAGDLVFSYRYVIPLLAPSGVQTLPVRVTDGEGRSAVGSIILTVLDPPSGAQALPFAQDWTNVNLIAANDNWAGVPGIVGYLGDYTTGSPTNVDPQTLVADMSATIDVIANQSNPSITNGGVAEFDGIANPTIALQGSGTADAPHIVLSLGTLGFSNVTVAYNVRDIDASADNAIQAVALQYRVGATGTYTNLPAGFIADATTGPSLATLVTPVSVQLPPDAANQPLVQIRIVTTNAAGNDEWVGIDDISVTGNNDPTSPSGIGAATPSPVEAGAATLLTVTVIPGINPASTGLNVVSDLSPIGGSVAQAFFDDGSHGDLTAGDRVFSFLATVGPGTTPGSKSLPFIVSDAQLRTSASNISLTVATPTPFFTIGQIQGAGLVSPHAGQTVKTNGIVTGVKPNGFFLQSAVDDGDPATSDGIFVFTSSAPPAAAAVGNLVEATGLVQEFVPSADPVQPPLTELTNSPSVTLVSAGLPLPAPIVLTPGDTDPAGSIEQLERYEGMRVLVESLTVVAPTQGNLSEANATSTSTGVFYGVITGVARPFREPGVQVPNPLPSGAPASVPRFDANPERLRVDSDGIGGALLDVAAGQVLTHVVGPLDYGFRTYTILPDPGSVIVGGAIVPTPVSQPTANQFTVGSTNLQRFFDDINDPGIGETVLTTTAFNNRSSKASLFVRNIMRSPDIIGAIEIENLSTLQALANRINADTVAAGQPNPNYAAYLEEGNDVGGIDVGFLVKSSTVSVLDVTQVGRDTTFVDPNDGSVDILNDRPPLILRATVQSPTGTTFPITAIVNHLRSLGGVEDDARVRAKRRAQSEFLATLIQSRQIEDPNERIISVGDYNAFELNDGYVDVIGTIKGTPTPADQVVLASPDLVAPNLIDLVETVPADQRYSYSFDGNAQVLDHALITENLLSQVNDVQFGRVDADFAETARNDPSVPTRLSDHDPLVVFFNMQTAMPVLTVSDVTAAEQNAGTTVAIFAVSLMPASAEAVTVQVATADVTATGGSDYVVPPVTTLTFPAGETTRTFAVVVNGDLLNEADETFAVNLFNATRASIGDPQGIGTIANDDPLPALSINSVTVREPASGTASAVFTVTLSAPSGQEVSVGYATTNGTATAGSDYVGVPASSPSTLTFAPGETSKPLTIAVKADTIPERAQFFLVNLFLPVHAVISAPQGRGTIVDAGAPLVARFSPSSATVGAIVVIVGEGFARTLAVRFNNAFSRFQVDSPRQITAVVPRHATDGPISVTNILGTDTSTDIFYVTPKPADRRRERQLHHSR